MESSKIDDKKIKSFSNIPGRKDRVRQHAEQFMIFVVGVLAAVLLIYVVHVFSPYIYPAMMAAIISIPIGSLNKRTNNLLGTSIVGKLKIFNAPPAIICLSAMLYASSVLLGLFLAILVVFGVILMFLSIRRVGPKLFLLLFMMAGFSLTILVISTCAHEFVNVSTDIVNKRSNSNAVFVDSIYSSLDTIDSVMKEKLGTGLYQAAKLAMNFVEKEQVGSEETTSDVSGRKVLANLLKDLTALKSRLTLNSIISRLQSLQNFLSTDKLMMVGLYAVHLISILLKLVFESAQRIIQFATFTYFLFYFIGKKESVLRYLARCFHWIYEVQQFVAETEKAFEFVISNYISQIILQIASSYLIFTLCGSKLSMTFSVLCILLTILPFMPSSMISLLVGMELFLEGRRMMALLCVLLHWIINFAWLPQTSLYKISNSSYFAELSILVGFYTFGAFGLILGPVLVNLPPIVYRLFTAPTETPIKT